MEKRPVEDLNLNMVGLLVDDCEFTNEQEVKNVRNPVADKQYYVDDNIFIAMDAKHFGPNYLRMGSPYRVGEGRVMMVTGGWVRVLINLEEYRLQNHSLLILVPDTTFEVVEWGGDFDMKVFSFNDVPNLISMTRLVVLNLDDYEWDFANEYFQLLWNEVHHTPMMPEVITHLQAAILLRMQQLATQNETQRSQYVSRQEAIFQQFLALVDTHGLRERKINFYADKLCLTSNYLGDVIKQVSGLTTMQWLNRHAVQKAKLMLRYSDTPVWEVSERLNFATPSFFNKFFKRETGMTPLEFRHNKCKKVTNKKTERPEG